MLTPRKGDYSSVPLSAEGRKVADTWDPAKLASDGCKAYGAAAIMRVPGRLRIAWDNDTTLKIDTDAGQQTPAPRTSTNPHRPRRRGHGKGTRRPSGSASFSPGGLGVSIQQAPPRVGSLKVVTTSLRAGYLRKNGVPYSDETTVTEYFDRGVGLRVRLADGAHDRGRSEIPQPAVHHQHALQTRARRVEMDADAVRAGHERHR